MRRTFATMLAAAAAIVLLLPSALFAAGKQSEKIDSAVEVLEQFMAIPENAIPYQLLKNANGIAVIPGLIKLGFIVGGRYGSGIVSVRDPSGVWSRPSFVTLTGGSLGWQIGAQSTDVILVFKTARSIENLMQGKFTLGADASLAAGPVGRRAEAATDATLKAEIYSYSRSRGLFAGLSLEGAVLQIDADANGAFYGREGIRADEIFSGKGISTPDAVRRWKGGLAQFAGAGTP